MKISQAHATSPDERIWAALSHGSVILFLWGVIVPLAVWITQRQKSTFAAFHALQALTYQFFQMIYWTIMITGLVLLMLVLQFSLVAIAPKASEPSPMFFLFTQFVLVGGLFCGLVPYFLLGIAGAILTVAGRDFRYPLLGQWMQQYLEREPASSIQEIK